jgi:hypothetical protein
MGFIGITVMRARPASDGLGSFNVTIGNQCTRPDGSGAPLKSEHGAYCVLCCTPVRNLFALSASIVSDVILYALDQPFLSDPEYEQALHSKKAAGIIANWSATSPPRRVEI